MDWYKSDILGHPVRPACLRGSRGLEGFEGFICGGSAPYATGAFHSFWRFWLILGLGWGGGGGGYVLFESTGVHVVGFGCTVWGFGFA